MASIVDEIWSKGIDQNTVLIAWLGSIAYTIQIFFDFSGYSDMAIGLGRMFGFHFNENFNLPYTSDSISEFWRRWHISLSKWLRDYIYFPLGGSRVNKFRWIMNIMIVFFISGLWHGANYTFIILGVLHGAFQIIGVLTLNIRNKAWNKIKVNPDGKFVSLLRIVLTFLLVDFCWIFFRANNISDAGIAITKIFTNWSFSSDYFKTAIELFKFDWKNVLYIVVCILSLPLIEKLKYIKVNLSKVFNNEYIRYITYFAMSLFVICSWIYLQASEVGSSFIYFQF
jgi:D-alanyl-lipoteichoic acid acyltransferase DltB (MBOAT superfamily)